MGKLDSDILQSTVKLTNSNNQTFDITVQEYLENTRGIAPGMASDGFYYNEVLGVDPDTDIFRSLSTKYIPAGVSFSTEQLPVYITADSNQSSFHIVTFEDKTKTMSEEAIQQAINTKDQGYTVKGKLDNIRSLLSSRIITLQDNNELIWKPPFSLSTVRLETPDGINIVKPASNPKDFLFWELVDRNVPDSDIVNFLADTYNLGSKMDDLDISIEDTAEEISGISNSISSLRYELDSVKTTVNFLANKIAEQKNQIAAVQSSVSVSASQLLNIVDHIDIEQGSNYIKLEDMSKSVQGLNYSLAKLDVLPSKIDGVINNNKDAKILDALDDVKSLLSSQNEETQTDNIDKADKIITAVTISSLILQVINFITAKDRKVQNER